MHAIAGNDFDQNLAGNLAEGCSDDVSIVTADAIKGPRKGLFYRAFSLSARGHARCFLSNF
jgi:hypothetical protein